MTNLSISLLGSFHAMLNAEPLTLFRTKSVQALLIYLVCEGKRPFRQDSMQASSREQLMDLLWPGMPLKSAQANLRQTVYRLRQMLPEVKGKDGELVSFLITNRQTIQINPEADYLADVHKFTDLIETAPEKAIELYRGDFLADFFLPDSETFEAWANNQREVYRRQALEAMEQVTAVSIQSAQYDQALQLAQRQLQIDNLRESSHRQLMEALARNDRRQEALTHYDKLRQLLQDELAIAPAQATRDLIDTIRADNFDITTTAPSRSSDNEPELPKHNLPQRLTSFVGREKEITAINDLISQHRLVMLSGVGGIGKTNLSLQVGQKMLDAFPDGVWLVELAPIADPDLVAQTAAHTLGLRTVSDTPIVDILLNYLAEKSCLLILDNCEHVINTAAQFAKTVLQACPNVKVLASSRELLAVPGEIPFHVPPLNVPQEQEHLQTEDWQAYEAVRLFVDRATAVLPHFQVTPDNIAPIVQICRRLDGIPLAIELAAARVKVLTTKQIAVRLDDRFRLLTSGSRTALPRQQTLRALIDWSWELLSPSAQQLLQRLSVFAGGMRLEAIEAVAAGSGIDVYDILNLLDELVSKSMVITTRIQGQETRYRLLETIRQYAQEQLTSSGHTDLFCQRHLDYYQKVAAKAEQALVGPDQGEWLTRLESEVDNIRAALNWAQTTDPEAGLLLANNLHRFWIHGYMNDGLFWLNRLLTKADSVTTAAKARALWVQGRLAYQTTDGEQALSLIEESLALYQHLEDGRGIARCLLQLGIIHYWRVDEDKARTLVENCLQICRTLDAPLLTAETLVQLSFFAARARAYAEATTYLNEAESYYRQLGHVTGIVEVLVNAGIAAVWQEDFAQAEPLLTKAVALQQQLGDSGDLLTYYALGRCYYWQAKYRQARDQFEQLLGLSRQEGNNRSVYWALIGLGYISLRQNDLSDAQATFTECLQMLDRMGLAIGLGFAYLFEGFATLALHNNDAQRAIQLFAAADALWQPPYSPRRALDQRIIDRDTAVLRSMVDEETFTQNYKAGQAMAREQVIAYLLEDGDSVTS